MIRRALQVAARRLGPRPPRVAVLGTCRVFDAVQALDRAGRVALAKPFWGFPHSAPEIAQIVEVSEGRTRVPAPERREALNMRHMPDSGHGVPLAEAEVVVMELSSLKVYGLHGYVSQSNRLAAETGLHAFRIDQLLLAGGGAEPASADEASALDGITAHRQTPAEAEAALLAVIDALAPRPVILANHFVVEREGVHPALEVRRTLRDICERVAAARPDRVLRFDPTPDLVARDYPIEDYAHYEAGFTDVVGERLGALIHAAQRPARMKQRSG